MTDLAGANPFDQFKLPDNTLLSSVVDTYDWVVEDGRSNFGKWVEEAVELRAKYGADDRIAEGGIGNQTEKATFVRAASVSASAGFAPKAPWCAGHVEG